MEVAIILNRESFLPVGTVFALEDVSYSLFQFETDGEKQDKVREQSG